MSTNARKRLMRDFLSLQNDPPAGITAAPLDDDIMTWDAVIFGPEGTAWEGGTFKLTFTFSEEYPNKPPNVEFVTKIFHPNVYANGKICLDILQNQWSPANDISAVLRSVQSFLADPNPNSPANGTAAQLYVTNRAEYYRKVKEVVEESWADMGSDDEDLELDEAAAENLEVGSDSSVGL